MKLVVQDTSTFGYSYRMRNDVPMERSRLGLVLILIGVILFFISLFIILHLPGFYLISLFVMFISVVSIAIGFAYTRSNDSSNDTSD